MFCQAVPLAACRLPKFAVESFEPKIGKKFLILVAASSAVAPRSAEIKYYVPSFSSSSSLPPFLPLSSQIAADNFWELQQCSILYHHHPKAVPHLISSYLYQVRLARFLLPAQINIRNSKLKLAHTHTQHTHTLTAQAVCIVENYFAAEK